MVYRKESLQRRIEKLREFRVDLREFQEVTFEEYIKDKRIKYSVERILFLIAENILDFLDHILSARFEVMSDSYEDILEKAHAKDLLSHSLHAGLKGLGSFRNILAHEYLELSDEEVFRNFKKMLQVLDEVIDAFEACM